MAYPTIQQLPPAPSRGEDFQTFAEKANAHVAALTPWTDDVNAAGAYIEATAADVEVSAATASEAAAGAQEVQEVVVSAANFVGEWTDLTGALNVPASVYHAGSYWQLLNDLADVTTSEPGVSAEWASLNTATTWTPISTSQTLGNRRYYAVDFTGGPLTLTLPATPVANDFIQFYTSAGDAADSMIDPGAESIMGTASGETLTIDFNTTSLHLVFNGTTWRIV